LSNNESFIDEVTEEVRKDRLYAIFRRYAWVFVLLVVGIVGGTAWTEWRAAQDRNAAQTFGDAILDALDLGDPAARTAALAAIPTADADQAALLGLMQATDPTADKAGAMAALDRVAAIPGLGSKYRDLAILRRTILGGTDLPLTERRTAMEVLATPGAPYRALALEQLALLLVEEGRTDDAIAAYMTLREDQEASRGLRTRADQMIVALGGQVPQAAAEGTP
jgi:hypothetical protein